MTSDAWARARRPTKDLSIYDIYLVFVLSGEQLLLVSLFPRLNKDPLPSSRTTAAPLEGNQYNNNKNSPKRKCKRTGYFQL